MIVSAFLWRKRNTSKRERKKSAHDKERRMLRKYEMWEHNSFLLITHRHIQTDALHIYLLLCTLSINFYYIVCVVHPTLINWRRWDWILFSLSIWHWTDCTRERVKNNILTSKFVFDTIIWLLKSLQNDGHWTLKAHQMIKCHSSSTIHSQLFCLNFLCQTNVSSFFKIKKLKAFQLNDFFQLLYFTSTVYFPWISDGFYRNNNILFLNSTHMFAYRFIIDEGKLSTWKKTMTDSNWISRFQSNNLVFFSCVNLKKK